MTQAQDPHLDQIGEDYRRPVGDEPPLAMFKDVLWYGKVTSYTWGEAWLKVNPCDASGGNVNADIEFDLVADPKGYWGTPAWFVPLTKVLQVGDVVMYLPCSFWAGINNYSGVLVSPQPRELIKCQAMSDWVDLESIGLSYVTCYPFIEGVVDETKQIMVSLPPINFGTPNVREDDIIVVAAVDVGFVCVSPYIDSKFGSIKMWSGEVDTWPAGWALCDGDNGTPDLTDRFIVGAGDTYCVGHTGGADHFHVSYAEHFEQIGAGKRLVNAITDGPGTPAEIEILPPYYALAFIQRVS